MAKQYILFSFENNDITTDMKVDKRLFKHFQTLTPMQKEAQKQLMIMGYKRVLKY